MEKTKECIVVNGDGRRLSRIANETIDCIITDHPWRDKKANTGGNRKFAEYETFEYELSDFKEKARVLKQGSFLCEIIPAESATNFEYLYAIKKMAIEAGFEYYSKIPWVKGTFVSNTGRKSKNTEDIMLFTKGKARELRIDKKRTYATGVECYMSGTNKMLPTAFEEDSFPNFINVQPVPRAEIIAQSEKPVGLFEVLLDYITLEGETVLDQYAGSGSVGQACLNKGRKCIMIEKSEKLVNKIAERLNCNIVK